MEIILKTFLSIILIYSFWFTNRWRGAGVRKGEIINNVGTTRPRYLKTKTMVYGFETILFALCLFLINANNFISISIAFFITQWICNAPGWGKYFPDDKQNFYEKEFYPVDKTMVLLFGEWASPMSSQWTKRWKTIAMTLRFVFTFGLIQTPIMAVLSHSWTVLAAGLLLNGTAGLIYRYAFDSTRHLIDFDKNDYDEPVEYAEHLIGAFVRGLFLSIVIWFI